MHWLRKVRLRFGALVHQQKLDAQMEREMRSHIEMQTQENIDGGMNPEEARYTALRQFGWVESIKETCRDKRGVSWIENLGQDIRFGARMLRKNPGFTAVAVLTLGLGIGANTAIFSVINGILLRPLPYRDPNRLVTVTEGNLKRGIAQVVVTPANMRDWREQNSVFEELGGQIYTSITLTGLEKPEHLHAEFTTPNFFSVFGVQPLLGRTFIADDKPPGGHRVVVLSYGLWQRLFAGDRAVIGKAITLSGLNFTVVGVMPEQFKVFYPPAVFGLPTGKVDSQLWAPYAGPMGETTNHYFLAFGRLKSGVTLSQAQNEMSTIAARASQIDSSRSDWGVSVHSLKDQIVGGLRPTLRLLLGAVGFVLLIACANVANLSLARSAARAREFAIRSALGAGRGRLVRQLFVESTILSILGGTLGVLLARWSLAGLLALQPANFPRVDEIQFDVSVMSFTFLISLLTGLLFGLTPALHASKPDLNKSLKESGCSASDGKQRQRARRVLVVMEIASAMILLAGAGLMINSFARLIRVDPGFEPEQLMAFDLSPAGRDYAEDAKRMRLVKQLRERIEAQPGVKSVATAYGLPFGTMLNSLVGALIEGGSPSDQRERASAAWRVVSPSYFKTMAVSFVAGRSFSEELDTPNSPRAIIINESFADRYFPGQNPIGRRIQPFNLSTNWEEIVGVIHDVKLTGLDTPSTPEIYQSDSQNGVWMFSLVVRSSLLARQTEKMVRAEVAAVDKDLPLFNIRTMEQAISSSVASRRFTMLLIGLFAALALTLTAVGIYGVVSYSVTQQTREIGIRMALGASRRSVLGLILGQSMVVALIGTGIGLLGSFALTRWIANQLFGISADDPATFAMVVAFLMLVSLAACYVPARRATKVDPMVALRYE